MYSTAGVSAVSAITSCWRQTFSNIVCGTLLIIHPLSNRFLRNTGRASPFISRAAAGLGQLDTIEHLEKCLCAGLDDVGAHARAAVAALIVFDVDDCFALRILTLGHAAQLEFP